MITIIITIVITRTVLTRFMKLAHVRLGIRKGIYEKSFGFRVGSFVKEGGP